MFSFFPVICSQLPITRTFSNFPWRLELSGVDSSYKISNLVGYIGNEKKCAEQGKLDAIVLNAFHQKLKWLCQETVCLPNIVIEGYTSL